MAQVQAEADRAIAKQRKAANKLNQALADLNVKKKEVDELRAACNDSDMRRVAAETKLQNVMDKVELNRIVSAISIFF
jgi:hypothetical protein